LLSEDWPPVAAKKREKEHEAGAAAPRLMLFLSLGGGERNTCDDL